MNENIDSNQIAANVITNLVENAIRKISEKTGKFFIDQKNKGDIQMGLAFTKYLQNAEQANNKIKTLLYRHTPKPIYSFYECIGVKHQNDTIDTSDINHILKIGKKLLITGTGGSGKSVMMKHFFLNTILNTNFVPILVELRGLNEYEKHNINLEDYIYDTLCKYNFSLEKKYYQYSLASGIYVILLDGFDEVRNELSASVTSELFRFCDRYSDNYYIITSRQLHEFIGWNEFDELIALPLNKKQALNLIDKLEYDHVIKSKFYKELNDNLFDKYESFASNPLLLTIMLMTFEQGVTIPDKLVDFYEQAFLTLFHAHDATKNGFKRDIQSNLGYEDFKTIFAYFCFKSYFHSHYLFNHKRILDYINEAKQKIVNVPEFQSQDYLDDLTKSVCMIVQEGLDYRFTHRSFQEYFAAYYTEKLDDKTQEKLIKSWLKDNSLRSGNYLDMLYEIQPDRFIKNIVQPAIISLQKLYKQNGKSKIWLISYLYAGMGVHIDSKNKTKYCYIAVRNYYYTAMIRRICNIQNYYQNKTNEGVKNSVSEVTITAKIEEKYGLDNTINFEQLEQDGLFPELYYLLDWVIEEFDFAVEYCNKLKATNKQNYLSILNDL